VFQSPGKPGHLGALLLLEPAQHSTAQHSSVLLSTTCNRLRMDTDACTSWQSTLLDLQHHQAELLPVDEAVPETASSSRSLTHMPHAVCLP
jgi:hypothetical protein